MTWHDTSQLTTVPLSRHLTTNNITSSHVAANHMTSYHITSLPPTHHANTTSHHKKDHHRMERLKAGAHIQVRWLVAIHVFYKQFFSLAYRFCLKLPPPARLETTSSWNDSKSQNPNFCFDNLCEAGSKLTCGKQVVTSAAVWGNPYRKRERPNHQTMQLLCQEASKTPNSSKFQKSNMIPFAAFLQLDTLWLFLLFVLSSNRLSWAWLRGFRWPRPMQLIRDAG